MDFDSEQIEQKAYEIKRYIHNFKSSSVTARKVLEEAEKRGLYKFNRKPIILDNVTSNVFIYRSKNSEVNRTKRSLFRHIKLKRNSSRKKENQSLVQFPKTTTSKKVNTRISVIIKLAMHWALFE